MKIGTCYFSLSPPPTARQFITHRRGHRRTLNCGLLRSLGVVSWWSAAHRAPPLWGWQNRNAYAGLTRVCNSFSSRVMASFCRQRSSPGRPHRRIVPLKVISALTYVIRSNGSVFTFHIKHSSDDQPTLKLKLPSWCGGKINCPPQPGWA